LVWNPNATFSRRSIDFAHRRYIYLQSEDVWWLSERSSRPAEL